MNGDGRLSLHGADLEEVAREWGTPLHVVDLPRLDAIAVDAMAPARSGSGADVFYSYKTNPVPGVLRRLHRHGVGAEVISEYELWLALRLGVAPERIIYNGPAKSDASLRLAINKGVRLVNANSLAEVHRIADIAAAEGVEANVGIRVALATTWGGQFGITAGSPQLDEAVRVARAGAGCALGRAPRSSRRHRPGRGRMAPARGRGAGRGRCAASDDGVVAGSDRRRRQPRVRDRRRHPDAAVPAEPRCRQRSAPAEPG